MSDIIKLYDVPRETYVKIVLQEDGGDIKVPIGAPNVEEDEIIFFSHIDGMYSFCLKVDQDTLEKTDEVCHLPAYLEVEIFETNVKDAPPKSRHEYKDLSDLPFVEIRKIIGRAGYGKDGLGEYRTSALKDMSDEWVKNSITYVKERTPDHEHIKYYEMELEYREKHGIHIED